MPLPSRQHKKKIDIEEEAIVNIYQNFQGSITRFEGSKKINKIQSLLLSTISAIIQSKGIVTKCNKISFNKKSLPYFSSLS